MRPTTPNNNNCYRNMTVLLRSDGVPAQKPRVRSRFAIARSTCLHGGHQHSANSVGDDHHDVFSKNARRQTRSIGYQRRERAICPFTASVWNGSHFKHFKSVRSPPSRFSLAFCRAGSGSCPWLNSIMRQFADGTNVPFIRWVAHFGKSTNAGSGRPGNEDLRHDRKPHR